MKKELKIYRSLETQIIIRWITSNNKIHNVQLIPLFGETYRVKDMMESVKFEHIYMEINVLVDELERFMVVMDAEVSWYITKFLNSNQSRYFHESFLEP